MKIFLLGLVIGLMVSVMLAFLFNWKGFGKPLNNEKYRTIELGKDSLVVDFYFEKLDRLGNQGIQNMVSMDTSADNVEPVNKANVIKFSRTVYTTPGCTNCDNEQKEKGRFDDCVSLSCIDPTLTKQQVIIKGPELQPIPFLRFLGINLNLKPSSRQ